jgi:signal transduction histidine kinase
MCDGVAIISERANSLTSFIKGYADLARLPEPNRAPLQIKVLMSRLARLYPDVRLDGEMPDVELFADVVLIEQLLINLIKNGLEAGGPVDINWQLCDQRLVISILDAGPGVSNEANLFVPFYTTKSGGSGIGLVLCRQIVESHGGDLTLVNNPARSGCIARIDLPVSHPASS